MTWLPEAKAETNFESVLNHRPELLQLYRSFYKSFWKDDLISPSILEICRLRIAAIHSCENEWQIRDVDVPLKEEQLSALREGRLDLFDPAEQSALTIAERIPYQHHQLTDDEVNAAQTHFTSAGCVALLTALSFFDVNCRLKLTFELDPPAEPVFYSPIRDATLS